MLKESLPERTIGGLHTALIKRLPEINHLRPCLILGAVPAHGSNVWQ